MPRQGPALKGRDEPIETPEVTVRGGQRPVISPLQGLLPEKDGVSFATQAAGPGFVSSPLWGFEIFPTKNQRRRLAEGLTHTSGRRQERMKEVQLR